MSIGVMVVILFFIILILVISTSYFLYHNQKKKLSQDRKVISNSFRPYDCQFPSIPSRIPVSEQEQINNINNMSNIQHYRTNSNLSQTQTQQQQQQQQHSHQQISAPPVPMACHLSQSVIASSIPSISTISGSASNVNIKMQMNSMRKTRFSNVQQPPQPQHQHSLSPTRMIIKPDIVVPNNEGSTNNSVSNTNIDSRMPVPTVASSIYTHSNSENYTDNYSNILASAEHYDLENASSIAPSDIDIVYHYKGFRNRDPSLNQLHHQKHAPLSRLSPSISELSSAPHILTLQDLSPQPVPVPPPQPPIMNHLRNSHQNDLDDNYTYADKNIFGRPW